MLEAFGVEHPGLRVGGFEGVARRNLVGADTISRLHQNHVFEAPHRL